jgi:hypothetical protein
MDAGGADATRMPIAIDCVQEGEQMQGCIMVDNCETRSAFVPDRTEQRISDAEISPKNALEAQVEATLDQ